MSIFFDDDEILRLCRKNKEWQPLKAIGPIEDCLKKFEETMHLETSKRVHLKLQFNQTIAQWFELLEKQQTAYSLNCR